MHGQAWHAAGMAQLPEAILDAFAHLVQRTVPQQVASLAGVHACNSGCSAGAEAERSVICSALLTHEVSYVLHTRADK